MKFLRKIEYFRHINNTDLKIFLLIGITILLAVINVVFIPRPIMGYFSAFFIFLLQIVLAYSNFEKKPILGRLLLFGITAGFVEIIADHFLVNLAGLSYNPYGIFILSSPIYMPFAWGVVIFQMGYIAERLFERIGNIKGSALIAVLSLIYIGSYEALAFWGNLWTYETTSYMVGHVPIYILIAEGIIFLSLPTIVKAKVLLKNWKLSSFVKGITFGLYILGAYFFTYYFFALL